MNWKQTPRSHSTYFLRILMMIVVIRRLRARSTKEFSRRRGDLLQKLESLSLVRMCVDWAPGF